MKWLSFFKGLKPGAAKALSLAQYAEQLFTGGGAPLRVNEAYSRVDAVSACILAKWTALDSIPWLLFEPNGNLIEGGPARALAERPHPQVTRTQFLAWLVISLDLRGKAFFWVEADAAGTPVALWPLVPQNMRPTLRVHPQTGSQEVEFWRYSAPSGKQVVFLPEELLTFRYPHPVDWWDGLARIEPANLAVSQYQSATEFQARSFANDGMISGLLTAKIPLQEDQMKSARESWNATYGGSRNAKKTAVLGSDWDYKRLALTPQELDYLASNKWTLQRICMALGVPTSLLGIAGDSALGSGKEKESDASIFWLNTILPLMSLIENSINPQLLQNPLWVWTGRSAAPGRRCVRMGFTARALGRASRGANRSGGLIVFDRDQVGALAEQKNRLTENVKGFWGMGVPLADLNDYYDLGLPDRPWHQNGYLPFSVTPADAPPADAAAPVGAQFIAPPDETFAKMQKVLGEVKAADGRKRQWQAHEAKLRGYTKKLRYAFKAHFVRQRIETLRRLESKRSLEFKTIKAGLAAEIIFNLAEENSRLTASIKPIIQGIFKQAGQDQFAELNDPNTYELRPRAEAYVKKLIANAEEVNRTNQEDLKQILGEEIEGGEIGNLDQLAERIREFYRERESSGAERAGATAAEGAYNGARTDAQEQLGITEQEWLSARDDHVRPTHVEADGQRVAIGEPFEVGSEKLMFPGDPSGSLEEIINCRCVAIPVTN